MNESGMNQSSVNQSVNQSVNHSVNQSVNGKSCRWMLRLIVPIMVTFVYFLIGRDTLMGACSFDNSQDNCLALRRTTGALQIFAQLLDEQIQDSNHFQAVVLELRLTAHRINDFDISASSIASSRLPSTQALIMHLRRAAMLGFESKLCLNDFIRSVADEYIGLRITITRLKVALHEMRATLLSAIDSMSHNGEVVANIAFHSWLCEINDRLLNMQRELDLILNRLPKNSVLIHIGSMWLSRCDNDSLKLNLSKVSARYQRIEISLHKSELSINPKCLLPHGEFKNDYAFARS